MKIENQTISVDSARRFQQLGFFKHSIFCYVPNDITKEVVNYSLLTNDEAYTECSCTYYDLRLPAYTLTELINIIGADLFWSYVVGNEVLQRHLDLTIWSPEKIATQLLQHLDLFPAKATDLIERSKFSNI